MKKHFILISFTALLINLNAQEITLKQQALAKKVVENFCSYMVDYSAGDMEIRFSIEDLMETRNNMVYNDIDDSKNIGLGDYLNLIMQKKTTISYSVIPAKEEWLIAQSEVGWLGLVIKVEKQVNGSPKSNYFLINTRNNKITNILKTLPTYLSYRTLNNNSVVNTTTTTGTDYTELVNGASIDMVFIPGGAFQMGSNNGDDDEKPVHRIKIDDFYIGKYEVSQLQWQALMGSNPSSFKGNNLPIERVSWNDAQEFIQKLNDKTGKHYRLPTEAEWEYACRSGTSTPFNTGQNLSASQANYDGNYPYNGAAKGIYRESTTPVGSFRPNSFGLYDMHGNVWEWCSDWFDSGYYAKSPPNNPTGSATGSIRVLRGGSWYDFAQNCRTANRDYDSPGNRYDALGFRLVSSK